MAPLRELGTPLFDMSGPTPFTAVQSGFDPLFPRNALRAYWKSQYLDELSDGAIDVLADLARNRPAPLTLVNIFHMGGAIAEVDPEATAFAERAAPFMVVDRRHVGRPGRRRRHDRLGALGVGPPSSEFGNGGVYLNFTGLADEARSAGVDTAFGRNLERLAQVKAHVRPRELLPRQQQHPACLATSRAARHPCRCAARAIGSGLRWTTITVFSNVCGPATRTPSRPRRASRPSLRRVARTFVRTSTAADEVVQETWLAVVRGLSAFEGRSSLRTWIFRILVNRARTRAVRDARSIPFSALEERRRPHGGAGARLPPTDAGPALRRGSTPTPRPACSAPSCASICSMPSTACRPPSGPSSRCATSWELPPAEVCELLGLTEVNQRVLLHRARARVRAALLPLMEVSR